VNREVEYPVSYRHCI